MTPELADVRFCHAQGSMQNMTAHAQEQCGLCGEQLPVANYSEKAHLLPQKGTFCRVICSAEGAVLKDSDQLAEEL